MVKPCLEQHSVDRPSDWVARWVNQIRSGGKVLDLACGKGRHSHFLAAQGFRVCAVDRDEQALQGLHDRTGITTVLADLESGPWPLQNTSFDGVVVTNYLHRVLFPYIIGALAPEGVLIYETFAAGNERFGKPSNPDFLLRPGELLEVARSRLRVVAYEDVEVTSPKPARVQRICACNVTAKHELHAPERIS
jgi:SAM-dependent methyltransferase